jgi:aromatic ring-cleaving dioxygenase
MKKIIFTLILTLFTTLLFAQDTYYLRSKEIIIGEIINNKLNIIESDNSRVLIEMNSTKITIFTKEKQVYRLISKEKINENKVRWYCRNSEGLSCYVHILFDESASDDYVWQIGIEFSDYFWMYVCKIE